MCRKQISLILILIFAFNFAQTQYKTESNISYYPEKISKTDSYIEVQDLTIKNKVREEYKIKKSRKPDIQFATFF